MPYALDKKKAGCDISEQLMKKHPDSLKHLLRKSNATKIESANLSRRRSSEKSSLKITR